jgi:putative ABC transport system permease protein
MVMGYENAVRLFENPEKAVGKIVQLGSNKVLVVGVTKKAGRSLIGGWDFDNIVMVSAKSVNALPTSVFWMDSSWCRRMIMYRLRT